MVSNIRLIEFRKYVIVKLLNWFGDFFNVANWYLLLTNHKSFNLLSRPGRSQGLLYKQPCDSLIK